MGERLLSCGEVVDDQIVIEILDDREAEARMDINNLA
jgi:hypothetical protein